VYNIFTGWKVVFDHIWKIDLIASAVSDFLYRKAILQKEEWSSRNIIIHLYFE